MDWTPYISGILVLAGTGLGIFGGVATQLVIQRNENARHLRKVAYDTAVIEWERMREYVFRQVDRAEKVHSAGGHVNPQKILMPILDDYIIHHLSLVDELGRMKPSEAGSQEVADLVLRLRRRGREVSAMREAFAKSEASAKDGQE